MTTPTDETVSTHNARHSAKIALLWLALLFFLGVAMPFVPVPDRYVAFAGAFILTALYVVAAVSLICYLMRATLSPSMRVAGFLLAALVWWLLSEIALPATSTTLRALAAQNAALPVAQRVWPMDKILLQAAVITLNDLALLMTAAFGGSMVALLVRTANMLGPVCAVVAMIDIWGVLFGGIVSQLMEKAPVLTEKMTASAPAIGAATASKFTIAPVQIGMGDYLFLGLVFAALHAHNLNWRATLRWMIGLIVFALWLILAGVTKLPGLLFIGLATFIPNWKSFEYSREEKFALLHAGIFVLILTVGLYLAAPYIVASAKNTVG